MRLPATIFLPFDESSATAAARWADRLKGRADEVILAGPVRIEGHTSLQARGVGDALRAVFTRLRSEFAIRLDPTLEIDPALLTSLLQPLIEARADAAYALRTIPDGSPALTADRLLGAAGARGSGLPIRDPFSGLAAFRVEALKTLILRSEGDEADGELALKLHAQAFRMVEVPVPVSGPPHRSWSATAGHARSLVHYGLLSDAGDGEHEGYATLHRMEAAPRYNAWLAQRLRPHLGQRVLEVGAGIGTITEQLHPGRELYVALERDPFYVRRLRNLFRDAPQVEVLAEDAAEVRWDALAGRRFDTVVLSNVLEHIEDDRGAVRNFRRALPHGGRVVIWVPALPWLMGELDHAVGHQRRYTREGLRQLLEGAGFEVERLEWANLLAVPGWFVNGRLLRRRALPWLQLRLYDRVAPLLAEAEARVPLPFGMSLLAVARCHGEPG